MPILPEHCRLNEREHSYYHQIIVDELFTGNTPSDHPRVVLLGGQPGSGKTRMRELAIEELASVIINGDDLRDYHPLYENLKKTEPERASFLVNEDVSKWIRKIIHQAVAEKRNIIFDGTFGTSDQGMLCETLNLFKSKGYESQLWILVVPAEFSKLGIYLRNEMHLKQTGAGRFVSMKVHDLNYRNIPANIGMAIGGALVDRVCFFRRSVELVDGNFVNNKVKLFRSMGKDDADYPQAAGQYLQMRNEPLSAVLRGYFTNRLNEVVSMINKRLSAALKAKDWEKMQSITQYKDQFMMDLCMNKIVNQEITL